MIVHAEVNAILAAARSGIRLKGCTMYVAATDASGDVWGGICLRCAVETIQAGISEVVSWSIETAPDRWHDSLAKAKAILDEAGIAYREIEPEPAEMLDFGSSEEGR